MNFLKSIFSIIFVFGITFLPSYSYAQAPTDPVKTEQTVVEPNLEAVELAVCDLFEFLDGGFGALLATVAAVGAVVAAAFGMYRAAVSFLVVALGAFIARSLVSFWFTLPDCTQFDTVPDQTIFNIAVCNILNFVEGDFGALMMTLSGLLGVISAAIGAYRAALGLLATGAGAVVVRSLVSLLFDVSICSYNQHLVIDGIDKNFEIQVIDDYEVPTFWQLFQAGE